jgi:hypothetical protein
MRRKRVAANYTFAYSAIEFFELQKNEVKGLKKLSGAQNRTPAAAGFSLALKRR